MRTSIIHRTPYGTKFLVLSAIGVMAGLLSRSQALEGLIFLAGTVLVGHRLARLPWKALRAPVRFLSPTIALLMLYHGFGGGYPAGVTTGLSISLVMIIGAYSANLLFLTTRVHHVSASLERALQPFHRWGLKPERTRLLIQLLLGSIPPLLSRYRTVREAAQARGLERNLKAHCTPLLLEAIAQATATAEALRARGLVD